MRMRKKKYLEERLNAVSDILFRIDTFDRNFNTSIPMTVILTLQF